MPSTSNSVMWSDSLPTTALCLSVLICFYFHWMVACTLNFNNPFKSNLCPCVLTVFSRVKSGTFFLATLLLQEYFNRKSFSLSKCAHLCVTISRVRTQKRMTHAPLALAGHFSVKVKLGLVSALSHRPLPLLPTGPPPYDPQAVAIVCWVTIV